ncbi:unnamed protein product, partial [marine sediment metagenome]
LISLETENLKLNNEIQELVKVVQNLQTIESENQELKKLNSNFEKLTTDLSKRISDLENPPTLKGVIKKKWYEVIPNILWLPFLFALLAYVGFVSVSENQEVIGALGWSSPILVVIAIETLMAMAAVFYRATGSLFYLFGGFIIVLASGVFIWSGSARKQDNERLVAQKSVEETVLAIPSINLLKMELDTKIAVYNSKYLVYTDVKNQSYLSGWYKRNVLDPAKKRADIAKIAFEELYRPALKKLTPKHQAVVGEAKSALGFLMNIDWLLYLFIFYRLALTAGPAIVMHRLAAIFVSKEIANQCN